MKIQNFLLTEEIIMGFFDDLTKNVSKVASETAKKTGQLTEIAKLKFVLHSEEAKLAKCYENIGRAYYAVKRAGEDRISEIASLFVYAAEINESVATIKKELASINKNLICLKCKTEVDGESAFCPVCGHKVNMSGDGVDA